MGLLIKTVIMELRKKQLLDEIRKLKTDTTRNFKLQIQKLQQQLDTITNGKH